MCRKIVWCYIFALTLLDCAVKTKLTAQGKSHGVSVQESLVEGITFQEWGVEPESRAAGTGAAGRGAAVLRPPALDFGRAALGAAHARTVRVTNAANTTLHLASIAGTTPDFHASFFDAKTLPPDGNTSFSVVYLGRREGPVSAHLYIHTSRGLHKYPVSAVGVGSEWGVWPLVGVRVPYNASVAPMLTITNPTNRPVQIQEVYSGASWLGLELACDTCRGADWQLAPLASRHLLRLRLRPPALPAITYVRIKADMPGGGLVVGVEASAAPAGEYTSPLALHPPAAAVTDPPLTMEIMMGNSARSARSLTAGVWAAACRPEPHSPPPPGNDTLLTTNGAGSEGVSVSLLRTTLEPHQELVKTALVTFHFDKLWRSAEPGVVSLQCAGWLLLGQAAVPYSFTLLHGKLAFTPDYVQLLTSPAAAWRAGAELHVRNTFAAPVALTALHVPPHLLDVLYVSGFRPQTLGAGAVTSLGRVQPRPAAPPAALAAAALTPAPLSLLTNVSVYHLPLRIYDGNVTTEWVWPGSADGTLRLGGVPAGARRRVLLLVRNPAPPGPAPAPACLAALRTDLSGARLVLPCRAPCCVPAGGQLRVWLELAARRGARGGRVWLRTRSGAAHELRVSLRVLAGGVRALPLRPPPAHAPPAPYSWLRAPLRLLSTVPHSMRLLDVTSTTADPALHYVFPGHGESRRVEPGVSALGRVEYRPELACEPHCYTGLDTTLPEGALWAERGAAWSRAALQEDLALLAARRRRWSLHALHANFTLHVHTDQVVQIPVSGSVQLSWPRLEVCGEACGARGAGLAGAGAGPGGAGGVAVRVHNPSPSHAILLQPALHPYNDEEEESQYCSKEECSKSYAAAFRLATWRTTRGGARVWRGGGGDEGAEPGEGEGPDLIMPLLYMEPLAEIEINIIFAPTEAVAMSTFLYLRNNLTILETITLSGEGAFPSFEINGRKPQDPNPILIEVTELSEGAATARVPLWVRNTGGVPLGLRGWRLAGAACSARGLLLPRCGPLRLPPAARHQLQLAFTADCTVSTVRAVLQVQTPSGPASFQIVASVPAHLLPQCGANRFRPSFEGVVRGAGLVLALLALLLALAAAALDAERELRRARAARVSPAAPRLTLDLRAPPAATPASTPASTPAAPTRHNKKKKTVKKPMAPMLDPLSERLAFERWRDSVLQRSVPEEVEPEETCPGETPEEEQSSSERAATPPRPASPAPPSPPTSVSDSPPTSVSVSPPPSPSPSPPALEDDTSDSSSPPEEPMLPEELPAVPEAAHLPTIGDDKTTSAASSRWSRGGSSPVVSGAGAGAGAGTVCSGAGAAGGGARRRSARRERPSKRRAPPAPRASPPAPAPPAPATPPAAPPAPRWGTSWSSVVAQGASTNPLPPIGSDVRRRVERATGDDSLFYFNSKAEWRAPPPPPPPAPLHDNTLFNSAFKGYQGSMSGAAEGPGGVAGVGGVAGGAAYGGVWGGATWGPPAPVPPPPGFTSRAVSRLYDPFHALSSIWAPGALDWTTANENNNNQNNNNNNPNNNNR